jgi:hypothetical protein
MIKRKKYNQANHQELGILSLYFLLLNHNIRRENRAMTKPSEKELGIKHDDLY